MPIDVHRRMLNLRPEAVRVYVPRGKPLDIKMDRGQKRWHNASEVIAKLDDWRRIELFDDKGELVDVINYEDTLEEDEGELGGQASQILNLLIKNNQQLMGQVREMFHDLITGYAQLAQTSVERANKAERAWMQAMDDLASLGQAGAGNGESTADKLIDQMLPFFLKKFMAGPPENIGKLKAEVEALEAQLKK
jgi:hypothetical protein